MASGYLIIPVLNFLSLILYYTMIASSNFIVSPFTNVYNNNNKKMHEQWYELN